MSLTARGMVLAAMVVASGGCGAKSSLTVPRFDGSRPDAGLDGGEFDGGQDAGPVVDECIDLPFREPPREFEVTFITQISSADIFFLVDVTGSMGEEISAIGAQLRDEIVPGLAAEIPDARFSVGHFADFPFPSENYGEESDQLFRMVQRSTNDIGLIQSAVDRLPLQGGRDGPEALVEALYLTASGEGFARYAPIRSCLDDTVGQPCFPGFGSRIILAFTDAPTHNGPGRHDSYRRGTIEPEPHTYEQAVAALRSIGAKVLGLYSGNDGGTGREDLEALARDTGAVRPDGTPIVLNIGIDGELLSNSVIEAVRTLVDEVPLDVDAIVEDVDDDAFEAAQFLDGVVAVSAQPADGATNLGDRFEGVAPGTRLTFRVLLRNELIPQTDVPQSFLLRVILRGDGVTLLTERIVRVVVPALGGDGCDSL